MRKNISFHYETCSVGIINICLFLSITGIVIDPEMVDKGYQLIGNSYYKIHTYGTFWDRARRTCISEGAHLAVINSFKEALHLGVLLRNVTSLIDNAEFNHSAFIGFHDMYEEGEYLTIFGKSLLSIHLTIKFLRKSDHYKSYSL